MEDNFSNYFSEEDIVDPSEGYDFYPSFGEEEEEDSSPQPIGSFGQQTSAAPAQPNQSAQPSGATALGAPGPFIPNYDQPHIETETVNLPGQQPIVIQYTVPAKPTLSHEEEMWDAINQFETDAWNPLNTGLKTGWAEIDKAFDGGLKSGFTMIAGDSNIGKTAFISQVANQVVEHNDEVYVMDFSLDDPMPDKLARVVGSGSKVLLNAVRNPNNYTHLPLMIARRKVALNKLRENVHKYRAYDANFTTFCEDIEAEIQRIKILLETQGSSKQICVFIDNFHDLNLKEHPNLQATAKYDAIAQWCSDTAIRYDIPVVCSGELKKLNGTRRPALDDIRESVKIKYEAKAVLLVYNEVHYKGEGAEVHFLRKNDPLKQPIFEVHFAKNKFNNFKGRAFFEFYPEMARMEEPDPQSSKHYASLVFSN